MPQKPTPHYTDLAAAMSKVVDSHDTIVSEIDKHAKHHAAHIAKMREERERDNAVKAGIERQATGLPAGSAGSTPVTLRVLDSNN